MWETVNQYVGLSAGWISLASALLAFFAWLKARRIHARQLADERRGAENIDLVLVREGDGKTHTLEYHPRRDQATRAEILGILGMYSGEIRYESSHLVPILESGDFDRMVAGSQSELRFHVSDADFDRFVRQDGLLNPLEPGAH